MFRQDTTCPALLTLIYYALTYTRVSLCPLCLSMQFYLNILYFWALSRSLAATEGISDLISFPQGTEMFHFPWFASIP